MLKQIYQDLLNNIPDYKEFLTVDELDANSEKLAAEYPGIASVFTFGKTKKGADLKCLKIDGGFSQNAMMLGCPHPNEPIGTMMLEYFSEAICKNKELRDELGFNWYIVKAWDADGLRLNEKWLKGPYTIHDYSRNFFRPASFKQVDWSFPVDHKNYHFHDTTPEAEAMMRLIDEAKPKFNYCLHNAGLGGTYWYITHDLPGLYEDWHAASRNVNVPLSLGEPESATAPVFFPAVYRNIGLKSGYDDMEKAGVEHPEEHLDYGECSSTYAREKYNTLTFLAELPYFFDKRIDDLSPSNVKRADAVVRSMEITAERNAFIQEILKETEGLIDPENDFYLAIKCFSTATYNAAKANLIKTDPAYQRMATVSELMDSLEGTEFMNLLQYGMAIRMLETELEKMEREGCTDEAKRRILEAAFYKASKRHKAKTEEVEAAFDYEVIPIWKLVYIQLATCLGVADCLRDRDVPEYK